MTFLEARDIVSSFDGGEPLSLFLAMSGTADPLDLFVRAAGAVRKRRTGMRTPPFNTLAQTLLADRTGAEPEIFLLLPWDFVPEADWRGGVPAAVSTAEDLRCRAQRFADLVARRRPRGVLYLPASMPPLFPDPAENASLAQWLLNLAGSLDARVLSSDLFSLGIYLAAGCPIGGGGLGAVAEAIVDRALSNSTAPRKVLVTDLDNVLWAGAIAEEGIDGICFGPEGAGYRHFIFQSLLAKLKREGTLLCAVTRNDPETAFAPLRSGRMLLTDPDFVAVRASYHAKSAQIDQLAASLNLGLDAFVFVDDNPIELAEVSSKLPAVRCVEFPRADDRLPALCDQLTRLFARREVTADDGQRTEFYRRRLASLAPSDEQGADLTSFLRGLEMKLTIHDRTTGNRTRAVQLINKTNQFNLNGRRMGEEDIERAVALGGRLYGAVLEDRSGSHGEVLACLISCDGLVTAFVLSCRVFQRRLEHAFVAWLAGQPDRPSGFDFAATPRNEPLRQFLCDGAFSAAADGRIRFDAGRFAAEHAGELSLFTVSAPHASSQCM